MNLKLLLAFTAVFSCGQPQPVNNYPYQYIETKREESNEMLLFAYNDSLHPATLQQFCKERKEGFKSGFFHFIVIFDKKENATFPKNPLTAMYGMDKDALMHIRAIYTFNKLNGYSKLTMYEKNAYESAPVVTDIP